MSLDFYKSLTIKGPVDFEREINSLDNPITPSIPAYPF